MVLLKDIFDLLATGELSNIKLNKMASGEIGEEDYPAIVGHINLGLMELYKRFNLRQAYLNLHILPGTDTYYLRPSKVSLVENMDDRTYIERGAGCDDDFAVLKVVQVYNADGVLQKLNDMRAALRIISVTQDTLHIAPIESAEVLTLMYQTSPVKIVIEDDFDPEETFIDIPQAIIEPLLYYVASRVFQPIGANSSTPDADKSAVYMNQYEMACAKIGQYGLDTQINDARQGFQEGGWV